MLLSRDLRRGRSCVFLMHVHLVFVTKYRRRVFTQRILEELRLFFTSVCTDFEAHLVEFEGEGAHVHLLVEYPPKVSVSKLVNSLKGVSSRLILFEDQTRALRPGFFQKKVGPGSKPGPYRQKSQALRPGFHSTLGE
ncbi:MAG: IS200/IS605 family transposase [Thermodesulfobacteriota bacterium]